MAITSETALTAPWDLNSQSADGGIAVSFNRD